MRWGDNLLCWIVNITLGVSKLGIELKSRQVKSVGHPLRSIRTPCTLVIRTPGTLGQLVFRTPGTIRTPGTLGQMVPLGHLVFRTPGTLGHLVC